MTAATPSTVVSSSRRIPGSASVTIEPSASARPAARAKANDRNRMNQQCEPDRRWLWSGEWAASRKLSALQLGERGGLVSVARVGLKLDEARGLPSWASGFERALQVVEGLAPTVLVRADCLLVPQPAMGEADRRDAVGLLEVELDQLPRGVPVPDPGERQAGRRVDLRVVATAAVLDVLVRVAHHHPHASAHAQVDLGLGRLPIVLGMPPAPDHLLASPCVEDRLGGRLEGALNA